MSKVENKAVFLSYASQDASAARRICESLRSGSVEVWFDQNELVGGDAWDAKIRGQIGSCALFVPIISAATQARLEGYFRIEWKLAAQRTHAMAEAKPFLLPVVIDDTRDTEAHVPAEFRAVQWTRLPAGDTSAKFCERVGALLGGQGTNYSTWVKTAVAGSLPPSRPKSRRMLFIAAVVAAVFALGFIGSRVFNRPVTAESAVRVKSSELIARAWAQLNDPALARSHLELANELCQRATTLDPDNADAWAAWSQVDTWYVYHGFDDTPARRDQANAKAARALRAAPGGFEPRLAQACYVTRAVKPLPDDFAKDAENTLRHLLAERPEEPRVLFALGGLLGRLERVEESAAVFDRMARHPAFAATALSEKAWLYYLADRPRFAEAVEPNERSLAIQPFWGNLALKATLATGWTGDLDAARAAIERIPAAQFTEGMIASSAWHLHFLRRDPKEMLRILAAVPNDWLLAKPFLAPKAYLSGIAQAMAGNRAAAEAQWGVALQQVGQRLAGNPNDFWLLETKAEILARMGDADAARRTFELARQLAADPRAIERLDHAEALLIGDADRAIANLERGIQAGTRDFTAANLRLDPDLDRLRGDPRFAALLARAEADPRHAPQPAKTPTAGSGGAAPAPGAKSVAVLAFENLSDDKANEYFSDGISEELLNALAKVPGLRVAARTSAFYFKGRHATAQEIGQKLGMAHLVDGTVRKEGNAVRVVAHLSRTDTGEQIWTAAFDGTLDKPWALQEKIAGQIAQALQVKLGDHAPGRATRTVDPEAHRLVLEGRYFWNQRSDAALARAEAAFRQAIRLVPSYAEAYAGLADVCQVRMTNLTNAGEEAAAAAELKKTREAAQRARDLDPSLAEPDATLGYVAFYDGSLKDAAALLQRSLDLNPNLAFAHRYYAPVLSAQGRLDLGLEAARRAVELDPLSLVNCTVYARALANAQRYAEAVETSARAIRLETGSGPLTHLARPIALWLLGRRPEAIEEARIVLRSDMRSAGDSEALWVLHAAGLREEVGNALKKLEAQTAADSYLRGFNLVAVGRPNEAWPFLQRTPRGNALNFLHYSVVFDSVRQDSRFPQLIVQLGYAEEYKVARATLARMLKERATPK